MIGAPTAPMYRLGPWSLEPEAAQRTTDGHWTGATSDVLLTFLQQQPCRLNAVSVRVCYVNVECEPCASVSTADLSHL